MMGYFKDEEKTNEAIQNGYFIPRYCDLMQAGLQKYRP
jgi:hypothetical protein